MGIERCHFYFISVMHSLTYDNFVIRLVISMFMGMAIGFEREYNQKRAGLRTQTLVTMGATAYVYISTIIVGAGSGDATRIAGQIASGVGFLGAGVIMREGLNIRGLNTAATLWCSSAVGCLAGIGLVVEAGFFTFCVIVMNLIFKPLANMISGKDADFEDTEVCRKLFLRVNKGKELYIKSLIVQFIIDKDVELKDISSSNGEYSDYADINVSLLIINDEKAKSLYNRVQNLFTSEIGVREMRWNE
jgi:putative Mg2+ transporter-C (MgtC) family protein